MQRSAANNVARGTSGTSCRFQASDATASSHLAQPKVVIRSAAPSGQVFVFGSDIVIKDPSWFKKSPHVNAGRLYDTRDNPEQIRKGGFYNFEMISSSENVAPVVYRRR